MKCQNKMTRRSDKLAGFEDADKMDGILQSAESLYQLHALTSMLQLVYWIL